MMRHFGFPSGCRAFAVALGLLLPWGHAISMSLLQAYEAALLNDPTYQAARHENEAGQQYRAIGRSSLLPAASASYMKGRTEYFDRQTTPTVLNPTGKIDSARYDTMGASVSLRQPLFNLESLARYRQGVAQSEQSEAVFSGRSMELIVRVVTAYVDVQFAESQLALATAQRNAYVEQMKVNQRMFELGEGTKTDMLETKAKAELSEAQVIEAQDNLATARDTLAAIVGKPVSDLHVLTDTFPIQPMTPSGIEEWKALAQQKNAELISHRHAVDAARQEVHKNRAGHFPRLDAVASITSSQSESYNTLGQEYKTKSAGLQLSIPLFSGGYVNAVTTQAIANHAKAKAELDAKTGQVHVELRKQHGLALSSVARIQALTRAVESARLLITATEKSIQGGVRINLDLLNAQQQLFTAQRDLTQARFNYLLAYLRLRYAAGILSQNDLRTVAGYFVPQGPGGPTR